VKLAGMLIAVAAVALASLGTVAAQEGDSLALSAPDARIGDRLAATLTVYTNAGAAVEVDPSAGWGGFEVVGLESHTEAPAAGGVRHTIVLTIAGFVPGERVLAPTVNIIEGGELEQRTLPPALVRILPTLAADAPLELSPLPPPGSITGAESPLLRPAIAGGVALALLAAIALVRWAIPRLLPRRRPAPEAPAAPAPDLSQAAELIDSDPVMAYRLLSATVRAVVGERYSFPAPALTTRELQARMERAGVERWEARLVGGLLSECDAVVYAGYRPAAERRQADLTMAREIVAAGEYDEQEAVA
jgi:hypothetical protein